MRFEGDNGRRAYLGTDDATRPPDPTLPIRWHELDDHEYDTALNELDQWVDWLIHRYRLDARTIPECWACHGEVVEELAALRRSWAGAFHPEASDSSAGLKWHADFADARIRLVDWVAETGCRFDVHRR